MFIFFIFALVNAHAPEEIEKSIKSGNVTVIEYMSPSCGFCQQIEDDIKGLIKDFELIEGANFYQVDCTKDTEKEFCEKTNTHAFPTIEVYKNNAYCTELYHP